MTVKRFLAGGLGTNCYLVINEETKEAVIVDPASCPRMLKECVEKEGLHIRAVLLTHAHFDHIMGIDKVIETYGELPVYVHQEDIRMLQDPELNLSLNHGLNYSYMHGTAIRDGQVLPLIGHEFRVLHTPGHTPGGVCYYVESEEVLFSGDTLFRESVGRTDFPGGSMMELLRSIKEKLWSLPENTHVYPGHMESTTIWEEKGHNPFVR